MASCRTGCSSTAPPSRRSPRGLPVLLLDADHDPLIGAATLPTNRRTVILPSINAEVVQVRDTAGSKNKLHASRPRRASRDHGPGPARGRPGPAGADRHLQAGGRAAARRALAEARRHQHRPLRRDPRARRLEGLRHRHRRRPRAAAAAGESRTWPAACSAPTRSRCCSPASTCPRCAATACKDGTRTAVVVQVHPDPAGAGPRRADPRAGDRADGRPAAAGAPDHARAGVPADQPAHGAARRSASRPGRPSCPARWSRPSCAAGACCRCPMPSWPGRTQPCGRRRKEVEHWLARKGPQVPIRELYWNVGTLSVATLVSYRRPGQPRGSPHQAIIPGAVALEAVLGPVEDVRILETIRRPAAKPIVDKGAPEPLAVPIRVHAPFHVIDVEEAWTFAAHGYRLHPEVPPPSNLQAKVGLVADRFMAAGARKSPVSSVAVAPTGDGKPSNSAARTSDFEASGANASAAKPHNPGQGTPPSDSAQESGTPPVTLVTLVTLARKRWGNRHHPLVVTVGGLVTRWPDGTCSIIGASAWAGPESAEMHGLRSFSTGGELQVARSKSPARRFASALPSDLSDGYTLRELKRLARDLGLMPKVLFPEAAASA